MRAIVSVHPPTLFGPYLFTPLLKIPLAISYPFWFYINNISDKQTNFHVRIIHFPWNLIFFSNNCSGSRATKLGHCFTVGLGGPLVWICLGRPFLVGPLCSTLFLALHRACQFSHGFRPSSALGLICSVAFVFPDSCHQGGSPRIPFLRSWTSNSRPTRICCPSREFRPGWYLY